jgi:hypothetical protein
MYLTDFWDAAYACDCGECGVGQVCQSEAWGSYSTCCTLECGGKECGSDGCGGSCGGLCDEAEQCIDGLCQCVPDCEDKQCGADGCGDECGQCKENEECMDGVCVCIPDCADKYCAASNGCGGVCCEEVECPEGPGYQCESTDVGVVECVMTCEFACEHEAECGLFVVHHGVDVCDCGGCDDGDPCTDDECSIPGEGSLGDPMVGGGECSHEPITGEGCS